MATLLIVDKGGFKTRIIAREKDGHFIKTKNKINKSEWAINQNDLTIIKVYTIKKSPKIHEKKPYRTKKKN